MLKNLVINELIKIYIRPGAWIKIGILLAFGLLLSFILPSVQPPTKQKPASNWKETAQQNITQAQAALATAKEKEQKEKLQEFIHLFQYRIKHNLPSQSDKDPKGSPADSLYRTHGKLMLYVATLISSIVAIETVVDEFSAKTIKLLLIRPAHRLLILFSKYLASLLFAAGCFWFIYIYGILAVSSTLGPSEANQECLFYSNGVVTSAPGFAAYFYIMCYQLVLIIMMVTLAFSMATFSRSSGLTISVVTLATMGGSTLTSLLKGSSWEWLADCLLFSYTDVALYEKGPSDLALTVVISYYAAFVVSTAYYFKTKDVL